MINAFLLPPVGGSHLSTGWNLWPIHTPGKSGAGRCSCRRFPPILGSPGSRRPPVPLPIPHGPPNTGKQRGGGSAGTSCLAQVCGTQGPRRAGWILEGKEPGREGMCPLQGTSWRCGPPLALSLGSQGPRNTAWLWLKSQRPIWWEDGPPHPTSRLPSPGAQFQEEINRKDKQGLELPPNIAF